MLQKIPDEILTINNTFEKNKFEAYLVGGCVRDLLSERVIKDWDFATNAKPDQVLKLFKDAFYDNTFGTVGIPLEIDGIKTVVEATTYRTEGKYVDKRHPYKVEWGKSIEEDLSRRDFTINAMALQINRHSGEERLQNLSATTARERDTRDAGSSTSMTGYRIIDPFHGQEDIKKQIVRAVGNPNERFKEDALRLMRAVRLATQLAFTIEENTLGAITNDASLLKHIAAERVRDELLKILASDHPYDGVMLLRNTNLLQYIIPELLEGIGVSQERPGRHHKDDVFTHNVLSLKFCPSPDPIVRFAALLHDVGKPKAMSKDKEGLVIFHNHEVVGAKIASAICEGLKFPKIDRERVVSLIRWHMFGVNENQTDSAIRRFIRKIGVENVKDMMDIRIADRLGSDRPAYSWRLKLFKRKVEEQLKPAKFSINDLAIDGHDIMRELNIKPGPKVGEILQKLFEEVDEDLSKNTKKYLINRLKDLA